jgi:hypothetical protein
MREYARMHYRKNKQSYSEKARKWEGKAKLFIDSKKDKPCADCGVKYHPCAMDFDHLPGSEKSFNISAGKKVSMKRLMAEIAKCEVVCSNCHRIRTHNRRAAP